jgi:MarR family transcriptional regulator, negative regulator of the multidrug operon emrRAB
MSNIEIMNTIEIFDLIERMGALIRSEERRKCTKHGLQPVHFQALDYLSRCNRYSDTPAALTLYLGMTRGTVSQTLLLLEKKGYLIKAADDSDRRKVHLHLTAKGKNMLMQVQPMELFVLAASILDRSATDIHGEIFVEALAALQKANKSESFGLCKTCRHFTTTSAGYLCGLTQETLTQRDSEKICMEHTLTTANIIN